MAIKERITEKVISEIDWSIIERVRELRKSKFSQAALSSEIGFSEGFIGRIENPNQSAIYSLRHVNLIAKALNVNIVEIMPKQPLKNDLIRITIKWKQPTKVKTGEVNYEIIKRVPLTAEEIIDYNNRILNRPAKSGALPKLKKRQPAKGKKR